MKNYLGKLSVYSKQYYPKNKLKILYKDLKSYILKIVVKRRIDIQTLKYFKKLIEKIFS